MRSENMVVQYIGIEFQYIGNGLFGHLRGRWCSVGGRGGAAAPLERLLVERQLAAPSALAVAFALCA